VDFKMVGNELIMSVDDDGEGIDTNMLQEITQRGVRADQYQSGHGIGLAMVADIVASMKGHLALEKSHLGGARFVVSFSRL
jgi:two-component system sensor histidine kinase PhoQ